MSKLVEKLENISRGTVQAMGFRPSAAKAQACCMVLIASLSDDGGEVASLTQQGADAVLVPPGSLTGKSQAAPLEGTAWGVSIGDASRKPAELKELGCDFLVFDPGKAAPALLRLEDVGKVAAIEPSLSDSLVRALGSMDIDAGLIEVEGETPLSVRQLMVYRRIVGLLGKPVIVPVPLDIGKEDLEELQAIGVAGVLVNLGKEDMGQLAQLRQAIDALPTNRKKERKFEPLVPRIRQPEPEKEEEEEEE